jgi:hypothetical protein
MNMSIKINRTSIILLALMVFGLLVACASPAPPTTSSTPSQPSAPTGTTTETPPTSPDASAASNVVKVVYFHAHVRCGACIYVETRTKYNVETYFKNELDSGKLTFEVYDLGDKANAAIANQYKAVGSQLFINVVKDGADHIKHIENVWMPKYLNDQEAFDELIQSSIKQALKGAS